MQITIRPAMAQDCGRILELVQELADYEKASEEVTVSLTHFTETGFGANPVWWAFVAEVEGSIVAFALYYIRFSTWKGTTMYLEDILVTEPMRGHQIGTLLFEKLFEEAKQKGWQRIAWQVLDWNEPAIHFYKKYNTRFDESWINCSVQVQ